MDPKRGEALIATGRRRHADRRGISAVASGLCALTACAAPALAQGGLYRQLAQAPGPIPAGGDPASPLYGLSMMVVRPPDPRTYKIHDLVSIIINEISRQKSEHTLDTQKQYDLLADLTRFPSIRKLLETQLVDGDRSPLARLQTSFDAQFQGDGTYERKDRFTSRITAEVIDVKPNGVLVLEARTTRQTDDEIQTIILTGSCRSEDITEQNTIQSSQIFNMMLSSRNEGELRNANKKGLIPRVLEAIFNF